MNWKDLLQAALVLVVRFVLGWFFALVNFAVDEAFLNAMTAAIVVWLLSQFGVEAARAAKLRGIL